jgi:hypothetical protein
MHHHSAQQCAGAAPLQARPGAAGSLHFPELRQTMRRSSEAISASIAMFDLPAAPIPEMQTTSSLP